jgi:uroporphyrinogen decarboxylase
MMRQAGRYMAEYRRLANAHPIFRERSETPELVVSISLQPFSAFRPDGVIIFSDILTPLPALGADFDIADSKGPSVPSPIREKHDVDALHPIDLDSLSFVHDSLRTLRHEIRGSGAALIGFVGSPWTLATYLVEGGSTSVYKVVKSMALTQPELLHSLLTKLADAIAEYAVSQAHAGADIVQLFDSWGGQLPPSMWEAFSLPYNRRVIEHVHKEAPGVPVALYVNGSGGMLERMQKSGADVVGLDWTVDMYDARQRLGLSQPVQGNVDPVTLFAGEEIVRQSVHECAQSAGGTGHVLNLGHGVMVGTPEENVAAFFDEAKKLDSSSL